jgi:deglycase
MPQTRDKPMTDMANSRILVIATNGFEQAELEVTSDKLRKAGAIT